MGRKQRAFKRLKRRLKELGDVAGDVSVDTFVIRDKENPLDAREAAALNSIEEICDDVQEDVLKACKVVEGLLGRVRAD